MRANSYTFNPPLSARHFLWDSSTPPTASHLPTRSTVVPQPLACLQLQATAAAAMATHLTRPITGRPESDGTVFGFYIGSIIPGVATADTDGTHNDSIGHEENGGILQSQLMLLLDRFDPGRISEGLHVPTALLEGDIAVPVFLASVNTVQSDATAAGLSEEAASDKAYVWMMEIIRAGGCPHIFPTALIYRIQNAIQIKGVIVRHISPAITFQISHIYPLHIIKTKFSADLLKQSEFDSKESQFGYVAIDQARQVLPLALGDRMTYDLPLIGLWAKNINDPIDNSVIVKCARYILDARVKKLETGKDILLLLHLAPKMPATHASALTATFFEVNFKMAMAIFDVYGAQRELPLYNNDFEDIRITIDSIDLFGEIGFVKALEKVMGLHLATPAPAVIEEFHSASCTVSTADIAIAVEKESGIDDSYAASNVLIEAKLAHNQSTEPESSSEAHLASLSNRSASISPPELHDQPLPSTPPPSLQDPWMQTLMERQFEFMRDQWAKMNALMTYSVPSLQTGHVKEITLTSALSPRYAVGPATSVSTAVTTGVQTKPAMVDSATNTSFVFGETAVAVANIPPLRIKHSTTLRRQHLAPTAIRPASNASLPSHILRDPAPASPQSPRSTIADLETAFYAQHRNISAKHGPEVVLTAPHSYAIGVSLVDPPPVDDGTNYVPFFPVCDAEADMEADCDVKPFGDISVIEGGIGHRDSTVGEVVDIVGVDGMLEAHEHSDDERGLDERTKDRIASLVLDPNARFVVGHGIVGEVVGDEDDLTQDLIASVADTPEKSFLFANLDKDGRDSMRFRQGQDVSNLTASFERAHLKQAPRKGLVEGASGDYGEGHSLATFEYLRKYNIL